MTPVTRTRHARRLMVVALAMVATLVVAACGSASATPKPTLGPITLEGTSWLLISYMSPTGTNYTVPMSITPTAKFSNGQFEGFAGCNSLSGPYTQDGNTVKIGPLAGTKKACGDPMDGVEAAYLVALGQVDTATGNAGQLLLKQSDGFSALEFVAAK